MLSDFTTEERKEDFVKHQKEQYSNVQNLILKPKKTDER